MEDRELLALLDSSPIQGRELLEALYREPVRLAAWQHLDSAQDVEVCVRETFAEFAAKRQRFDPSKGGHPALDRRSKTEEALSGSASKGPECLPGAESHTVPGGQNKIGLR